MNNIYSYNTFDKREIMDEITDVAKELEKERSKMPSERDNDKEFKLIYQQFVKGLKLSTRNNF